MTTIKESENNKFIILHDILQSNGKTIKENNLELKHNIPVGTLVEVKFNRIYDGGSCSKIHARMWVVSHDRDCDGTPLYSLSFYKTFSLGKEFNRLYRGFILNDLLVVEMTKEIEAGYDNLEWGNK